MIEQTQFQNFSNNTKFTCMMISVSLLILIITTIAPSSPNSISNKIGKLCAIALLGYALVTNCQETTNLIKNIPDLFNDANLTGIRNNTVLSYLLSFIILISIVYVTFTFF